MKYFLLSFKLKDLNKISLRIYTPLIILISFIFAINFLNAQVDGDTPLLKAVKNFDKQQIISLVGQGENVNAADKNGGSVLMWAICNCDLDIVKFLIKNGADYKKNGYIFNEEINKIKYYYSTPLSVASGEGKIDIIKYLIEDCKADINEKDNFERGYSALHSAVVTDELPAIKYLIENGADVNIKDKDGNTPLSMKIIHPRKDIRTMKFLCLMGADLSIKNKEGKTAYNLAENWYDEITPFFSNPHLDIFLIYSFGFDDLVIKEINKNKELISFKNSNQELLLHLASSDFRDSLAFYLINAGADVKSPDIEGCTPLFNAVKSGRIELAKLMIDKNGNVNIPDRNNITPFMIMNWQNCSELLNYISKKGIQGDEKYQMLPELVIQRGHMDNVRQVDFSPDGKYFVSGAHDNYIKLWDFVTGIELHTFINNEYVESVSFSPDSKYIASGGKDMEVKIWDILTGKVIKTFKGHTSTIYSVRFSPDGKFLVSRGLDNSIKIWDIGKNILYKNIFDTTSAFSIINFRSDGKFFASGSGTNEVKIWNIENGELVKILSGHDGFVYDVSFNPDGTRLASRTVHGTITIWDIGSSEKVKEIKGEYFEGSVSYTPDGKYIIGGCRDLVVYDAETFALIKKLGSGDDRSQLVISSDSKYVGCGNVWDNVTIWDINSGKTVRDLRGKTKQISNITISPDGKFVSNSFGLHTSQMWNLSTGSKINLYKVLKDSPIHDIECLAFSPDNLLLAIGGYDRISILDLESGNEVLKISKETYNLSSITFSSDSRYIAGISEKSAHIWDIKTGKEVITFKADKENLQFCCFSPDGSQFAGCEVYGSFYIWDFKTGKKLKSLSENDRKFTADFGNDSKHKIYYSVGTVIIYNTETGKILNSNLEYNQYKGGSTISSFGNYYYKSIYKGCFIYDLKKNKEILRLEDDPLTISPDEKYFVTTNSNVIKIFDIENRSEYKKLAGHSGIVQSGYFTPDLKYFISGSEDGSIKIWDWQNEKEIATIVPIEEGDDYIIVTPDQYYLTTKEGFKAIAFRVSNRAYPPEQYDLRFNRPDIVLERIGYSSPDLIESLRKAYEKRLKKMNFNEEMFNGDFHVPEIEIMNNDLPLNTTDNSITLNIKATDSKYKLDRINLYVNDVAIYGTEGINLRENQISAYESNTALELSEGKNKIQMSVLNDKGVESLKETVEITRDSQKKKHDLYVITIGASDYNDSRYKLKYAAKDANDIADLMLMHKDNYNEVKVTKLLNKDVTKENIQKIKDLLMQSKVDDEVIIFIAGHGLLTKEFDYYFATSDIDFSNPQLRGVTFEEIENLFDGIPARKKILLMDTCHSGELDKEDLQIIAANNKTQETREPVFTRDIPGIKVVRRNENEGLGLKNVSELMQALFVDLRRGSGAAVISSSGGLEVSYEGGDYKNGFFTYAILEGIKTMNADLNKDHKITITELRNYVSDKVEKLTKGAQIPTARKENLENDFVIW